MMKENNAYPQAQVFFYFTALLFLMLHAALVLNDMLFLYRMGTLSYVKYDLFYYISGFYYSLIPAMVIGLTVSGLKLWKTVAGVVKASCVSTLMLAVAMTLSALLKLASEISLDWKNLSLPSLALIFGVMFVICFVASFIALPVNKRIAKAAP